MDQDKTSQELIAELEELQQRVAALEGFEIESKRANDELTKSKAILTAAIECLPFDFYALDPEGRCILQNAVSRRYFGDAIGKKAEEVCPDRDALPRWLEANRRALGGARVETESQMCVGGEHRHFFSILAPIMQDGTLHGILGVNVDITQRKRAEQALQESEERFRKVFEEGPIGVALVDRESRIQHVNSRFCHMLGYSEEEIIALGITGITHPDDCHLEDQSRMLLVRGQIASYTIEKRFVRKDRQVISGQLTASMMHDAGGNPVALIGMIEETTDRKRAEEALRASEQRYRLLMESVPQAVWRTDPEGNVLDCNRHWSEYTGQTPEEAKGAGWRKTIHPDDLQRVLQDVKEDLAAGEIYQCEQRVRRASDGSYRWHLARGVPVKDHKGMVTGWIGSTTDIHDQKCAEEALWQSEHTLRTLMDASPESILLLDSAGTVLFANKTTADRFGRTVESLVGTTAWDMHSPEVAHERMRHFQEVVRTGQPVRFEDVRRGRYIENALHPVLDDHGEVVKVAVLGIDQTERKRAEEALQKARDQLERRVEERTAELETVNAQLRSEADERKRIQEALAESEMKYRQLVETTGTGYVILDNRGRIIDANPEYLRISGHRTREEILGRTVVEWTAPYDVDRNAREVEKCYRNGFVRQLEIDYIHPDGKIIPLDINATCLDSEAGRRIVCLCRDITERRQAREALERERQSLWKMLQASDHERQIISYEIHDGLAQYLAAAGMQFQAHDALSENSPEEAKRAYQTAVELVRQAHAESRRLISEVRPPVIDEIGLETAISHLVHEQRRHGGPKIECRSNVQFKRLPPILENSLYRIVQEALTNACKHSKSRKVTVTLAQDNQNVRLEVQDWGVGFDPDSLAKGHFGVEGIRQRVRLLGGRLKIESRAGVGTLIQAVVPIVERHEDGSAVSHGPQ